MVNEYRKMEAIARNLGVMPMSVDQALGQCHRYPHGCRKYQDAYQIIWQACVDDLGVSDQNYNQVWDWVDQR